MEGTCRVGEGSWLPLPLIVAAVIKDVLAVATGSPPSTCSLSLAIGVNETGNEARCNIRCVQISHCGCTEKEMSRSPGGDDHIPFLYLKTSSSCWNSLVQQEQQKMGCTILSRFDFSDTTSRLFFLPPLQQRWGRRVWNAEFLFYAGAAPFTFENRRGKKGGRSDRWRKVHTSCTDTKHRCCCMQTLFLGRQ